MGIWKGEAFQTLQVQKMSLRQAASFWGCWLLLWLALCMTEGNDSGLPHSEENRGVKSELSKADEWVDDSGLPTECSPRKLTKRSIPSDISWISDPDGSRETNCQIFPVTTALPQITPSRVSTKDLRKGTTRQAKAASPEEEPRLFYFVHYNPHRQFYNAFYNVLFPINRGASSYNPLWYYKSRQEDSSEEKRKKRDTPLTSRGSQGTVSLEEGARNF